MNDNYVTFKFEIQLLYACHEFNNDSVYTISVEKIYSKNFIVLRLLKLLDTRDSRISFLLRTGGLSAQRCTH